MIADSDRKIRNGCRLLSLSARLAQRRQDDVLVALGLTRAAVITLEGLAAGARNREQLATAVHARSRTIGRILARLQIAGLVSRSQPSRDPRHFVIGLTGAGRVALEAATANRGRGSPAAGAPDLAAPPSYAQPGSIENRSRARLPSLKPAVHPRYQIKK
ncbi:MarR family transcriptional regulator [Pseudarthrobacter sp. NPDC055928]|uniref:MarR family transcriptional regulator n=1 Tax=Pseudarthrobacter sp. NPDC055928 TaxID=3345661 RepID=UPI0035DA2018